MRTTYGSARQSLGFHKARAQNRNGASVQDGKKDGCGLGFAYISQDTLAWEEIPWCSGLYWGRVGVHLWLGQGARKATRLTCEPRPSARQRRRGRARCFDG
jgi:hypothetical protein